METILRSKNVLINEEFIEADVVIYKENIKRVDKYGTNSVAVDLGDLKIVPGIVDLHSDAIEKEIEPRHGAVFPIELAVTELDKKLSMAGVTTMFHAIGFEDNLKKNRSIDLATKQIEGIFNANKKHLGVDNFIHARFELSATDAIDSVKDVISKGMVKLLSLMDHSPGQGQFKTMESFKTYYGNYYGLNDEEVQEVANKKLNKNEEKINELINYAKEQNLTLLSHDDDSIAKLNGLYDLGVKISEFPLDLEVAKYAVSKGIATGMGAPNIVRGGRRQRKSYNYNLDTAVEVKLEFNEAVFGCKKDIEYKYKTACKPCSGTGAKDGKMSTCRTCQGAGQVHSRQGFMTFAQTCPTCSGTGQAPSASCDSCGGTGYDEKKDSFKVDIPEGVNDGMRIRVSNKGNIAPDGSRGDLYLQVSVKEDSHFVRHDDDIYYEAPIFFTQVALGGKITIPGLRGELELEIPKGAKDKQQFTFRNEGVKSVQGHGKGSLIVQIKIEYPKKLNEEQKELLEKLQESFGIESKPHEKSFENMFDKVKKWFS